MPRLSIGLPVYNGQKYIGQTIESILSQSYRDFQLIINDNASTDDTEKICRNYCEIDKRIHYFRNVKNVGPAENFNLVFKYSRGDYFKWAAHDDLLAPTFLQKCVEVLEEQADVVVVYPKAMLIDSESKELGPYREKLATDSSDIVRRFHVLLRGHSCYEIFGLIRKSALMETPLMGFYAHGDGVLLSRLSLLGRFVEIPEYLFFPREHADQSMALLIDKKRSPNSEEYRIYTKWFNPKLKMSKISPYWRLAFEYLRSIHVPQLGIYNKLRCYKHLINWVFERRSFLLNELLYYVKHS